MSSFAGVDLFGSGPHQIVVGGLQVSKKRTGFTGTDGVESLTMGHRGRPITIVGLLKAATRSDLNDLIGAIEDDTLNFGLGDLIDADGGTTTDVELDGINLTSSYLYGSGFVMIRYVVRGRQRFASII